MHACQVDCKWACCHCCILARISTRHAVQHRPSIYRDSFKLVFILPFHHYFCYPKEKPDSLSIFCFGSQGFSLSRVFPAIRTEVTDYLQKAGAHFLNHSNVNAEICVTVSDKKIGFQHQNPFNVLVLTDSELKEGLQKNIHLCETWIWSLNGKARL